MLAMLRSWRPLRRPIHSTSGPPSRHPTGAEMWATLAEQTVPLSLGEEMRLHLVPY